MAENKKKSKFTVFDICLIGVFTAVTAVSAQIIIPIPGVPFTMQTFAVLLTGIVLGAKKGAVSVLAYVLLGAVGVPVFSGFTGGLQSVAGPTGGFILAFPLMAVLAGLGDRLKDKSKAFLLLFLALALIVSYVLGVGMFSLITKNSFSVGFTVCVLPFIIPDILKAVLAASLGGVLKKELGRLKRR